MFPYFLHILPALKEWAFFMALFKFSIFLLIPRIQGFRRQNTAGYSNGTNKKAALVALVIRLPGTVRKVHGQMNTKSAVRLNSTKNSAVLYEMGKNVL